MNCMRKCVMAVVLMTGVGLTRAETKTWTNGDSDGTGNWSEGTNGVVAEPVGRVARQLWNQGMKPLAGWFSLATPVRSVAVMDPMTGRRGSPTCRWMPPRSP